MKTKAAFNLYKDHSVQIVKTGYVGKLLDGKERHSSQFGVRHYRKVIELAADKHIMIDNHEPVMPTGLQRTFAKSDDTRRCWRNKITSQSVP